MEILTKTVVPRASQVDMYRRLRLSSMLTLFQETAIEHTISLGCPREKTLDRGLLWIVTHYSVRIRRMPVYDERLELKTWPGKTMHLFFPRYWQICDGDGTCLVEASSLWVLMNAAERKIAFPEQHGISIPGIVTGREIPLPAHQRMPEGDHEAEYVIPPSLVDMNGHLNNAKYIDIVQDVLPLSLYSRSVRELSIEYVNEIRLGRTMRLKYALTPDRALICGEDGRPVFRMQLVFGKEQVTDHDPI